MNKSCHPAFIPLSTVQGRYRIISTWIWCSIFTISLDIIFQPQRKRRSAAFAVVRSSGLERHRLHSNMRTPQPRQISSPPVCFWGTPLNRWSAFSRATDEKCTHSRLDLIKKFGYNFFINEEVCAMPNIRSSAELRNQYNEISTLCHEYAEPVFITKNGKGEIGRASCRERV